jgi:hypothetical protein
MRKVWEREFMGACLETRKFHCPKPKPHAPIKQSQYALSLSLSSLILMSHYLQIKKGRKNWHFHWIIGIKDYFQRREFFLLCKTLLFILLYINLDGMFKILYFLNLILKIFSGNLILIKKINWFWSLIKKKLD